MMPFNDDNYYGRRNHYDRHNWNPQHVSAVPAQSDEDDLELMWSEGRPPWTPFDTFLRRALMIGGLLLIYAALITGVIFVIDISVPDNPSPSHETLLNTDKPLIVPTPEVTE